MTKYYVGLDVHKLRTRYCLVDEDGCIVDDGDVASEDVGGTG